jgi:phenylalanyl-tRNA synthetase beta chain
LKFSYNWIAELVDGLAVEPAELTRLITMKTAESEGAEEIGVHLDRVCAALVTASEPVGKNHCKATVDTVRYGVKTVICGASNCRAGIVTAYVPAGTRLGAKEIGKAVIDGVESDGMLASGAELGLNRDAAGIMELDGVAPGAGIPRCMPDYVIDIDNKSLTHRPDLWGHHGMAREVAAITRRPLLDPVDLSSLPSGAQAIKVEIQDYRLCPRYSALVFENVTVKPSPLWLQYRLEAIGLNPINNIVDVTNYVLAELAQPMHAFDADTLQGDTIFVRPARAGESIQALNGETYALDESNLVIADAAGPVAVGGVIGGLATSVQPHTTRIVLESANFFASGIRKTSVKLRLRTDASMRFEKAQDPVNTLRGLARALTLLEEVSPGIRLVGGLVDAHREAAALPSIELPLDWLQMKLGRAIDTSEVVDILTRLQFGVTQNGQALTVVVPSWRATKDVSMKDDLVEEVGRMIGYDSITPRPPMVPTVVPPDDPRRMFLRGVRALATARGFTEVSNYSFVSNEEALKFGFELGDHVRVTNPIAADQSLLRVSLIPGLARNIHENSKHFDSFRLFEIGREIHPNGEELPHEIVHLGAVCYQKHNGEPGLFELKSLAESLMPGVVVQPAEARVFEHPARTVELCWQGGVVGRLFEMHPCFADGRAAVLDIDLELVQAKQPSLGRYKPLRRFPVSAFDLSVVTGMREFAGTLQAHLEKLAGGDLTAIEFLRVYSGPPLAEGSKSTSFRLTVGATDRTLSSDEVAAIRGRIIAGMEALGYELRV